MTTHTLGGHDAAPVATPPRLLTVREAAAWLNVSKSLLDKLRVTGGGPRARYLGRIVRYAVADLDAWAAERAHASTSARDASRLATAPNAIARGGRRGRALPAATA